MSKLSKNEFNCPNCGEIHNDNNAKFYDMCYPSRKIRLVCGTCKEPFGLRVKMQRYDYTYLTLPITSVKKQEVKRKTPRKRKVTFQQLIEKYG